VLILALLVMGIAAGWAGQKIVTPRAPVDWTAALPQGLIGSFVGGLLASLISGDGLAIRMSGFLGSIVGAVIVIAIAQAWRRRRA
jgi:uncharacterized membrane protein YeaQ/YmgE (transglycosylase-associated protein family)